MMEAYQQRVIAEKGELESNIKKLNAFMGNDRGNQRLFLDLPIAERMRMDRQLRLMIDLGIVLGERIEAFGVEVPA